MKLHSGSHYTRPVINTRRRSTAVLIGVLAATTLTGPAPALADNEERRGAAQGRAGARRQRFDAGQRHRRTQPDLGRPAGLQRGRGRAARGDPARHPGARRRPTRARTRRGLPGHPADRARSARWTVPRPRPRWRRCARPAGPRSGWPCAAPPTTSAPATTTRRIVLITDGEDTCAPPDPCEVARELAAQGTSLVVDTLGLVPDEKVRKQLICIADGDRRHLHRGRSTPTNSPTGSTSSSTGRTRPYTDARRWSTGGAGRAPTRRCSKPGVYTDREAVLRAPLVPGAGPARPGTARLGQRGARPAGEPRLRGAAAGAPPPTAGSSSGASDAGSGRTDVVSAGLRWSGTGGRSAAEPSAPTRRCRPTTVCLVVSNSFSAASGDRTSPGMPVELTIDVVDAVARAGRARTWAAAGCCCSCSPWPACSPAWSSDWLTRWRVAVWRTN